MTHHKNGAFVSDSCIEHGHVYDACAIPHRTCSIESDTILFGTHQRRHCLIHEDVETNSMSGVVMVSIWVLEGKKELLRRRP